MRSSRLGANAPRQQGWIQLSSKSMMEAALGTCRSWLPGDLANYADEVQKLSAGCSVVVVRGDLKESPAKGQATELHATEVRVLGWADPKRIRCKRNVILSRSFASGPICARGPTRFGACHASSRNQISQSIHQFFHENGFFYINTPIITASDCEGCGRDVSRDIARSGDAGKERRAGELFVRLL